jgi:hypothetical protein
MVQRQRRADVILFDRPRRERWGVCGSVSPAKKDVDLLVKGLVNSFNLVPRSLDAEEAKRLASEATAQR